MRCQMLALAKPFLPYILGAVVICGGVWYFSHARFTAGYEARSAEIDAERARAQAENERNRKTAGEAYRKEDNALTDRVLSIEPGIVRLCVQAPSLPVPEPAGRVPDAPEERRPGLSVGRDIGREALVLATECERDRRKLIALQDWVRAQGR